MRNLKAKSFNQESFSDALAATSFTSICKQISAKEPLTPLEIGSLVNASLPQLLKCVELSKAAYGFKRTRLKAAFFAPLNKTIADKGGDFAVQTTTSLIERMSQTLDAKATLYFQIDSWAGATPLELLLEILETILQSSNTSLKIEIVPPDTNELRILWRNSQQAINQYFSASFFARLSKIGIENIVGGDQHQILRLAATHNCRLSIRCDFAYASSLEPFCETLIELNQASYRNNISSWSLQVDEPFQLRLNPTITFRALAIARLLLTDIDYIGLDLTLCDPPLLRLATLFGANDFGYAGIDSHTASSLGIPTLSEAEKITGIALAHPAVCSYRAMNE